MKYNFDMYNDSKINLICILSVDQYNHEIIIKIYFIIIIKIRYNIKINKNIINCKIFLIH